jgi:predicted negative regulator of RcsB-dependent stress response
VARLTRKELKSDKFALEVENTFEFFSEHRKEAIRYGLIGAVVVLLVLGWFAYRRHQHAARQEALSAAIGILQSPVGPSQNQFVKSYATAQERNGAASKAFADLASKYSGSDEALIAEYYLGTMAVEQGKTLEAEKWLKDVVDGGNANYASLAKLTLASLYRGQGKTAETEKLLRSLVEKPTAFVSKQQATIALARVLAEKNPAEARKLLEPLQTEPGVISQAAIQAISELPPAK